MKICFFIFAWWVVSLTPWDIDPARLNQALSKPLLREEFIRPPKAINPATIEVVPKQARDLITNLQNWTTWVDQEFPNPVFLLPQTAHNRLIITDPKRLIKRTPCSHPRPMVGLPLYLGLQPKQHLKPIKMARQKEPDGVSLFAFNEVTTRQLHALGEDPFKEMP